MQKIPIQIKVRGTKGELVSDQFNVEESDIERPTITRGMQATLELELLKPNGYAYPAEDLQFDFWDFVLAHDWDTDPTRSPVQIRATEISVANNIVSVILGETNTEELVAILENKEQIPLGAELAGMTEENGDPKFLLQFDMVVRNRRGAGGLANPTPVPGNNIPPVPNDIDDGEYVLDVTTTDGQKIFSWAKSTGGGGGGGEVIYYEARDLEFAVPPGVNGVSLIYTTAVIDVSQWRASASIGATLSIKPTFADTSYTIQDNDIGFAKTLTSDVALTVNTDGTWIVAEAISKPAAHTHTIAQVTGLQAALDGKAQTSHTHTIANVTGLQVALDGKAPTSHTHTIANITNLQATLNGKAPTSHTHTITNVSGLQSALNDKIGDVSSGPVNGYIRANIGTYDPSDPYCSPERQWISLMNALHMLATKSDTVVDTDRVICLQYENGAPIALISVPASAFRSSGGGEASATLPLTEAEWASLVSGGCMQVVNGVQNTVQAHIPTWVSDNGNPAGWTTAFYAVNQSYGVWDSYGRGTIYYDAEGKRYVLDYIGCDMQYKAEKNDGASPAGTYTVFESSDASVAIGAQYQVYPEGVCP